MREEWWWPWGELPRSLKLAAVNLGYDEYSWQAEEFKHSGQRFVDWEEVEIDIERGVEIGREGIGLWVWRVVDDDAGSACSDSELISGHDAEHALGIGWCSGHDGQSRLGRTADAMFVDVRTHWICLLSPAAAAPVRVPMLLTVHVVGIMVAACWKTGVDLIGRIV